MEIWGVTDSGKVRKHNQDVFKVLHDEKKDIAILVVCDGMGGANAGDVASQLAVDTFMRSINNSIENVKDACCKEDIAKMMIDAVLTANNAVYSKSQQDDDYSGMGTTLTAAVSTSAGEIIVNVGDSRLYHITSGKITQITRDHSVVEDMIERGEITRSQARRHSGRNLITRALGASLHEPPDVFFIKMNKGESILLCSDGLTEVILDSEIQYQLITGTSVRESCETLVDMALERGAPDNVTAVILRK